MKLIEISEKLIDQFCGKYGVQLDPNQPKTFKLEVGDEFIESDDNIITMMAYMADIIPMEQVKLEIKYPDT